MLNSPSMDVSQISQLFLLSDFVEENASDVRPMDLLRNDLQQEVSNDPIPADSLRVVS